MLLRRCRRKAVSDWSVATARENRRGEAAGGSPRRNRQRDVGPAVRNGSTQSHGRARKGANRSRTEARGCRGSLVPGRQGFGTVGEGAVKKAKVSIGSWTSRAFPIERVRPSPPPGHPCQHTVVGWASEGAGWRDSARAEDALGAASAGAGHGAIPPSAPGPGAAVVRRTDYKCPAIWARFCPLLGLPRPPSKRPAAMAFAISWRPATAPPPARPADVHQIWIRATCRRTEGRRLSGSMA